MKELLLTMWLCLSLTSTAVSQMNPLDFVDILIDLIEKNSIYTKSDFDSIQVVLENYATRHKEGSATNENIAKQALKLIGDTHGFVWTRKDSVRQVTQNTGQYGPSDYIYCTRLSDSNYFYLNVPPIMTQSDSMAKVYAQRLHTVIDKACYENEKGNWIVDLRQNWGGNMWPMLAGLSPFFSSGALGAFYFKGANRMYWYSSQGVSKLDSTEHVVVPAPTKFDLSRNKVIVLISALTSSSGEAIAIAFKSRPNTCFIGENTSGLTTSTQPLWIDNINIYITTSRMTDSQHRMYPNGIAPALICPANPINLTFPDSCISNSQIADFQQCVQKK